MLMIKQFRLIWNVGFKPCITLLLATALISPAWADAGWISGGGNPQLMIEEHKTISMKREVVDVQIGKELITVDCKFEFKNNGPACKVRMGFPDIPIETGDDKTDDGKQFPFFFSYRSYVDGKEVETSVEKGKSEEDDLFWHSQDVEFAANAVHSVRDIYTIPAALSVDYGGNCSRAFYYILRTGASWQGKIGSGLITIKFDPDILSAPLKVVSYEKGGSVQPKDRPDNMVVYDSNLKAISKANSIQFRFKNFEPKDDGDNVAIEFGKLSEEEALQYFAALMQKYLDNKRNSFSKEDVAIWEKFTAQCQDLARKKQKP